MTVNRFFSIKRLVSLAIRDLMGYIKSRRSILDCQLHGRRAKMSKHTQEGATAPEQSAQSTPTKGAGIYIDLPVSSLKPNDYNFNQMAPGQLKSLAATVKAQGFIVHPVIVRPVDLFGAHIIIDGEHQWRAAMEAGLETVSCQVIDADTSGSIAETYRRNGLRGEEHKVKLARAIIRMKAEAQPPLSDVNASKLLGRTPQWVGQVLAYAKLADIAGTRPVPFPQNADDVAELTRDEVKAFLKEAEKPVSEAVPQAQTLAQEEPDQGDLEPAEDREAAAEAAALVKLSKAVDKLSPEAWTRFKRSVDAKMKQRVKTASGEAPEGT